ncbi:MAG: hypothetical protein ACJ0HH_04215, partial [Candidatus Thalassarchaeum sp.]
MVLPQILGELICQGIFFGLFAGGDSSSKPFTTLAAPQKRPAKIGTCAHDDCNALSFRSTDYCWKHQDETLPEPETEPEAGLESGWW